MILYKYISYYYYLNQIEKYMYFLKFKLSTGIQVTNISFIFENNYKKCFCKVWRLITTITLNNLFYNFEKYYNNF